MHIPEHHFLVEFHDGPLDGQTLPIYDKVLQHRGWCHGIPSRSEPGNGGVIWSYAHRWPTGCPRYVLTPGEPNIARWRPITNEEFNAGEFIEAQWRHWLRVLHPFHYAGDTAYFARKTAEDRGITDSATLHLIGCQAVAAVRDREGGLGSYLPGDTIPDDVEYVCDVRGNLQVRVQHGRARWFQPGKDAYTAYPDRHVWIPPIRTTSALLRRGPLTVVPHDLITAVDRAKLNNLRAAAIEHENSRREHDFGDA